MKIAPEHSPYTPLRFFWLALALVCMAQAWLVVQPWHANGVSGSTDTDPWVRLVRVEKLISTGGWYDRTIEQLNPPQGMQSHWTRPLDVVLILFALPLTLFMTTKAALFAVASWLNALWLLLSAMALVWAVKPLRLGIAAQVVIAFGFAMDPLMTLVYAPGRASDHHSVLALLAIVLFGLCVHSSLEARGALLRMRMAGAVAAIGIWIAPEFLVATALVYGGFGLRWLLGHGDSMRHLRSYSLMLCAVMLPALLIERGAGDLLTVQHDRLSVVHVTLVLLILLLVSALLRLPDTAKFYLKLLSVAAGGAVVLGVLHLLFPGFHLGPMAAMDPSIRQAFNDNVNELKAAFDPKNPMLTVSFYDAVLVTSLIALWRILSAPPERPFWVAVLMILVVFGTLTAYQLRWNYYLLPYGLIGLAVVVEYVSRAIRARAGVAPHALSLLAALVIASSCIWPALFIAPTPRERSEFHAPAYTTDCSKQLQRMIQHGRVAEMLGSEPVVVLTAPYIAPQLIYFTPHKAIASFYHNLTAGMGDLNRFFYVRTPQEAKDIVTRWDVRYLLFCVDDMPKSYDKARVVGDLPFIAGLLAGDVPQWLARMPGSFDPKLIFFRVR